SGLYLADLGVDSWQVYSPADLNAVVIAKALIGDLLRERWIGYTRWSGPLPASFHGAVHDGRIAWDEGGALDRMRLNVLGDGSAGESIDYWAGKATEVRITILPGAPRGTGRSQCRLPVTARRSGASEPGVGFPGTTAQPQHFMTWDERQMLETQLFALESLRDISAVLAQVETLTREGWLPDLKRIMEEQGTNWVTDSLDSMKDPVAALRKR